MRGLFVALFASFMATACTGVQLGREFDEHGNEIEQPAAAKPAKKQDIASVTGNAKPQWAGEEDYYGDDERVLSRFDGQIGDITIEVKPIDVMPYANTREQRWSARTGKLMFWRAAKEQQPSEEAQAAELAVKSLFKPQYAEAVEVELGKQLNKELNAAKRSADKQRLIIRVQQWGASDDFGLYSANLRVMLTAEAQLVSEQGELIWKETIALDAGDSDRPSADLDELAEHKVLLAHNQIASQFLAYDIAALLTKHSRELPLGYNRAQWVDE